LLFAKKGGGKCATMARRQKKEEFRNQGEKEGKKKVLLLKYIDRKAKKKAAGPLPPWSPKRKKSSIFNKRGEEKEGKGSSFRQSFVFQGKEKKRGFTVPRGQKKERTQVGWGGGRGRGGREYR